jgi:hypothetical protein
MKNWMRIHGEEDAEWRVAGAGAKMIFAGTLW